MGLSLALHRADVRYGKFLALREVDFRIDDGSFVGIAGPNGAGKSTLLKLMAGVVSSSSGTMTLDGKAIDTSGRHRNSVKRMLRHGIVLVPEGRRLFADLTVRENLLFGGYVVASDHTQEDLERVYASLPKLASRANQLAGSLSGGEQQMLAIGRALMSGPRLLLVDELSLGLAPAVAAEVRQILARLRDERGVSVVAVEENLASLRGLADEVAFLRGGRVLERLTISDVDVERSLDLYLAED